MRYVVIGGGIGGVCCAEELCRLAAPGDEVALVSASPVLKGVSNVVRLAKYVEEFTVVERDAEAVATPNLRVVRGWVAGVDPASKTVRVAPADGGPPPAELAYDALCICAGARPKVLSHHERVVTLRDTESVQDFAARLAGAHRVVVVGNGGIALELVGEVRGVEVVWALRHAHIGDAFFDADAAQFLLGELTAAQRARRGGEGAQQDERQGGPEGQGSEAQCAERRESGAAAGSSGRGGGGGGGAPAGQGGRRLGAALGPKWSDALPHGAPANVRIERHATVLGVYGTRAEAVAALAYADSPWAPAAAAGAAAVDGSGGGSGGGGSELDRGEWPAWVALAGPEGRTVMGADLVVSAIGVEPATEWLPACLERAPDGGLSVRADLRTSDPSIWAAGDCCTLRGEEQAPHFFQMRLWTQARLMGLWAAQVMAGRQEDSGLSFAFELFTHVTRFLGKKVVFVGLYNGQKLGTQPRGDVVTYSRTLDAGGPGSTFVRVLLLRGRMQGAVLIGDTDLEETFENLILDGLDVGGYGPALLDPNIELDHVFD
ncbi:hypothetical protein Rsub_12636 [Raphidocelis subcapitata]|uniref:FAD/NAD(P)-binding domain-containing protein n=1 Tax=Raphidocelis subcapitata TaxID=307507 RepID=A0A2V0PP69_9CHLO|nr:hypothetical protein Rsub_12636 [Raphidocelis subcapitata]|eukprot:GBF99943.1 hypothetical protein Rsub_12636 [Raphidocelis subcapitata]